MEGGDGSLYLPPSQNPGILSPACWAVSRHPWGPRPHPSCLAGVPPDPLPSVDITWSLGGGCPPTCLPFSPAAPTREGGPGPRCAAGSPGGPLSAPPRAVLQHPTHKSPRGFPCPPSPSSARGGGRGGGPVQFLLIPTFRQSRAPLLPRERPEQSQVCSPPVHTPLKSPPLFLPVTKSRCEAPAHRGPGQEPERPGLQRFLLRGQLAGGEGMGGQGWASGGQHHLQGSEGLGCLV